MFTQIFLSEIISTTENGGRGAHFLISQILKGLTHCALSVLHRLFGKTEQEQEESRILGVRKTNSDLKIDKN